MPAAEVNRDTLVRNANGRTIAAVITIMIAVLRRSQRGERGQQKYRK